MAKKRKQLKLRPGMRKTESGRIYELNKAHRWERAGAAGMMAGVGAFAVGGVTDAMGTVGKYTSKVNQIRHTLQAYKPSNIFKHRKKRKYHLGMAKINKKLIKVNKGLARTGRFTATRIAPALAVVGTAGFLYGFTKVKRTLKSEANMRRV